MNLPGHTYTRNAYKAFAASRKIAEGLKNNYVGAEHLCSALLGLPDCRAVKVLERLGKDINAIQTEIMRRTRSGAIGVTTDLPWTPRARRILKLAEETVEQLKPAQTDIGTGHILLGILSEGGSLHAQVLQEHGVTIDQVAQAIKETNG